MTIAERIKKPGPKRILALDGGGIRGMLAVEVLGQIEELLRNGTGGGADFVLADYFDLIAGTSTGAIIATTSFSWMAASRLTTIPHSRHFSWRPSRLTR